MATIKQVNEKLLIYERLRQVPKEAQKTIIGGRLKGMTDINPVWRIKMLTSEFGPVGFGWKTVLRERWTESYEGEVACFVRLDLFVKIGNEWSEPIEGIGGSKLVAVEKTGPFFSDEAYKMAYTDAISVACKSLGMAADIYFAKDAKYDTKYEQRTPTQAPQQDLEKVVITDSLEFKPLDKETYWKAVQAAAEGKPTKSGVPIRQWYTKTTHAGQKEIEQFDLDVQDYKAAVLNK